MIAISNNNSNQTKPTNGKLRFRSGDNREHIYQDNNNFGIVKNNNMIQDNIFDSFDLLVSDAKLRGDNEPFDINDIDTIRSSIKKNLELDDNNVPDGVKVATMTLEGKFNTIFYPLNIYKYIKRNKNGIVDVVKNNSKKHKNNNESENITEKSLCPSDKISAKKVTRSKGPKGNNSKNRQSEEFLNQVTVSINVKNKKTPVSVKIFNNGTIHFTGCISIDNLLEAVYILCAECKRKVAIIDSNGKIIDIKFVENPNVLHVKNLYDIQVDMINCVFMIPFKIDRPKLQIVMKTDGYNATYDSNGHAGVKIKYNSTGEKITIFVFESGSIIIIFGKQGFRRINEIYVFIYKYLLDNYELVAKDDNSTTSIVMNYLKKIDINKLNINTKTNNQINKNMDTL